MFSIATTLIHSFLTILSPLMTLGCHPTTEFKKCVFFVSFCQFCIFEITSGGGYPLRDEKKIKDPGNERIRFCLKISEILSAQLQKLAENEKK